MLLTGALSTAAATGLASLPAAASPASGRSAALSGTFTDLGTARPVLTLQAGAVTARPDGSPLLLTVPAGENAQLNVVDLEHGELVSATILEGVSGSACLTTTSDGRVYIGTYWNGSLYRYDPADDSVTNLGVMVPGETYLTGIIEGPDGMIFGGTNLTAHVFRHDPDSGQTVDLGSFAASGSPLVRALAHDPDTQSLLVPTGTTNARLYRVDLATGTRVDITPSSVLGTSYFQWLWLLEGTAYALTSSRKLYALDPSSGAVLDFTNEAGQSTQTPDGAVWPLFSPPRDGVAYSSMTIPGQNRATLHRLDLTTRSYRPVRNSAGTAVVLQKGPGLGGGWATRSGTELLFGINGNYTDDIFAFDPSTATLHEEQAPWQWAAPPLSNITVGPAGTPAADEVFLSAGINGDISRYTISTASLAAGPRLGQVEGWAWRGGVLYAGAYPNAAIRAWDPAQPSTTTNPVTITTLQASHAQNRPYAVVANATHLHIGTSPDYGSTTGALTSIRLADNVVSVHAGIVGQQTVVSVCELAGALWCGSATSSANGGPQYETQARLVRFDPATQTVTAEVSVPTGAREVNALTAGPDGNLWALAGRDLIVVDPASAAIVDSITGVLDFNPNHDGAAATWHTNGRLYLTSVRSLYEIDPLAMTSTLVHGDVKFVRQHSSGALYLLHRGPGQVNWDRFGRYLPQSLAENPQDLRRTVFVRTVDSTVRNRFTPSGATLADAVNQQIALDTTAARVRSVGTVLTRLQAGGVVTGRECGALLRTVARV